MRTDPALGPSPHAAGSVTREGVGWMPLAAITLLGLALRVIGLDGGLWWDEIRTLIDSVRQPLRQIVTVFPGNNQHTFYSVLAHLSTTVLGEAPWTLRLPALLFGVATPPLLFLLAREVADGVEALVASLVLAVSYHHVWFSQNARGYTTLAFFAVLCTWLLLRGLRRGRAADFVAYGIAAGFGAYTHLTMVFIVVGHALACTIPLGRPRRRAWPAWRLPVLGFTLAGGVTLLLYAPLLADLQQFFVKRPSPNEGYTPRWAAGEMLRGLAVGWGTVVGALAAAGLMFAGAWSYLRASRFVVALFLLPGVVTVAASLLAARPIFPRFLFFLIGFGVLFLVRGAFVVGQRLDAMLGSRREGTSRAALVIVAVITAVSLWSLTFDYRYPKQDFAGALRFVEANRAPGDAVVTAGGAMYPYREYLRTSWRSVRTLADLDAVRAAGTPVWMVYTLPSYIRLPAPDLWNVLRADCSIAAVFRGTVADGDVTVCVLPPRPIAVPAS